MSNDFKDFVLEDIEALARENEEMQSKIDHNKRVIDHIRGVIEAYRSNQSNLFDGAKMGPVKAVRSFFDKNPDVEVSTAEIKDHIEGLRDDGLLDSKPDRTANSITHSALNQLADSGYIVKTRKPVTPQGPAYYRKL